LGLSEAACSKQPDRVEILHGLVLEVVREQVRSLLFESQGLHAAVTQLAAGADPPREQAARHAWCRAMLAWKRAAAFRSGPVAESKAYVQAMFWPARPKSIDVLLSQAHLLDESRVAKLGPEQRGLHAVEYLLFARDPARRSEQELGFLRELCANVLAYAQRGAAGFGDGQDYAQRLAAGGQDSLSLLSGVTTDAVTRVLGSLARCERASKLGRPSEVDVQGYYSKTSHDIAWAMLSGAQALFTGGPSGGVGALVGLVSPPVETRAREQFAGALQALERLGRPLEQAVFIVPEAFATAVSTLQALENSLKFQVASALGV
jgi:putative iron-regulated protein